MSASRFFSASTNIAPFPMRACTASILQSFAVLSIAGVTASLFAVPAFAQGQSASSPPGCSPASGTPYQVILCGTSGGVGQTGQSPSPIAVSVTSPQTLAATPTWSAMQLETYGGAGGSGGSNGSDGGAGAAGSGITAAVDAGVNASGANPGGILQFISQGGAGGGGQGAKAGTVGKGGAGGDGGQIQVTVNGSVSSTDASSPGLTVLSQGGSTLYGDDGTLGYYPSKSGNAGGSGPVSVAIGGVISTVATGALVEAFGGAGVKGADDNAGLVSAAGSNGGDGGASSSPVEASVTGTIQSSAGDGIDVLAQGGAGGQGGLGQYSSGAGGGAGGGGGSAPQSTLTISGSVSAATLLYQGVVPSNGALVRSAGGQGGDGNTGNGGESGTGGNGGNGGNGNNATLTLQSGGSVTGGINVLSAVSGGGDGGAGGDASGSTTTGGNGGVGGVGGNASVDVGQTATGVTGATTSVTGAPHQATVAVSAISYGGAGGAGAVAAGGNYAGGGTGAIGGQAGSASVTIESNGVVITQGDDTPTTSSSVAPAVLVRSNGGVGGAGGKGAAIGTNAGDAGQGGAGNTATAVIDGTVTTSGSFAHGVLAQSVGGMGGKGGDASGIFYSRGGAASNGGAGGQVYVSGSGGSITTTGTGADGILAQSVGGGGGSGGNAVSTGNLAIGGNGGAGGDAQAVTVGLSGSDSSSAVLNDTIITRGDSANAIVAQSIGDAGGNGGNAFAVGTVLPTLAIGGDAKGGGSGSTVTVQNDGLVTTFGQQSGGIEAQSIGGGGGNGGAAVAVNAGVQVSTSFALGGSAGSGQSGGAVTLTNNAQVSTYGADAYGIKAQSIGGGGGQGGSALATAVALSGDPEFPTTSVSVAIGGGAGAGGDQTKSPVTVNNAALVTTAGDGAIGIIAQNIAGGGGNGGDSTASSYAKAGEDGTSISASSSVGGKGGAGGSAGAVTVNGNGGLVATMGADAYGVLAQSLGGGGGVGGTGDSAASSGGAAQSFSTSITVGGSGGTGGSGGSVNVNNNGNGTGTNIVTAGDGANAILAQSIGGGGGASGGGTGTANGSSNALKLAVTVGGNAGKGGTGGQVTVDNSAALLTKGADADAIIAQSIGGGGGKAGKGASTTGGAQNPETVVNNMTNALANGLGTGSGGATKVADGVYQISNDVLKGINGISQLNKAITGGDSGGVQAVRDSDNDSDDDDDAGSAGSLTLQATIGGKGGTGGIGGSVDVANTNAIETDGVKSDAIFAQSIGGGGGVGGATSFSGSGSGGGGGDTGDTGDSSNTNAGLTLGGNGVSGGDSSSVTVANSGTIATNGVSSYAIDAQSVGGGGGKGAVTGSQDGALKNFNVTVGGSGGAGGNGGTVTVTNDGAVATSANESFGILAQSVGGGGGTAQVLSSDIGASDSGNNPKINVTLGGSGGAGGAGNTVQVTMGQNAPGSVNTSGADAIGIVAQSIGGGGGTLTTTSATNSTTGGIQQTTSVPLQIGDKDGASGNGGEVDVTLGAAPHSSDSYVLTTGAGAYGILAQSVGGGGGLFVGATPGSSLSTLFGGTKQSGDGGAVNVNMNNTSWISTSGAGAVGVFAQSVGGGGGVIGSMQNVNLASGLQSTPTTESGQGGNVSVNIGSNSSIVTAGDNAHAIFAQAVGGGGGVIAGANNSGYAFAGASPAKCSSSQPCTGNVSVALSGGSIVRTSGQGAYGIYVQSRGNGSNNTSINIGSGSSVESWANSAGGIFVDGAGTNTIDNYGTIDNGTLTNKNTPSANGIVVASASTTPVAITNEAGSNFYGNTKLADGSTINGAPTSTLSATSLDLGGSHSTLINGGTLEVGGSAISSLQINGNVVQQQSGQIMIDSDYAAGASDRVSITGNATLAGQIVMRPTSLTNSAVDVMDVKGTLDASQLQVSKPYLVDYALSSASSANAQGNTQSLYVTPHANFTASASGLSANGQAVASHLQANFDAGATALGTVFAQMANGIQDHAAYGAALNRLGNETQQSVGTLSLAASHAFVERMYSCPTFDGPADAMMHERDCVWGRVIDNHTSSDGADSLGYNADTYAMQFGAQYGLGDGWFLGGSVGYGTSSLDGSDGVSDVNGHGPQLGVVLKKEIGNWTISGGADAGYAWYDSNRNVNLPAYAAQAKGDFNSYEAGLHSRVAYTLPFNDWYMKPYVDVHLVHFHTGGYTEQGAGALDLAVNSASATTLSVSPMFEVGGRWTFANGMILRPDVGVGGVFHSRDHWSSEARFVDSAPGVAPFTAVASAPSSLAKVKVDLNLSVSKHTELKLEYGGQFGGSYKSNEGMLKGSYIF
jgi:hypothetical protein